MSMQPQFSLTQVVAVDPTAGAGVPGLPYQLLYRSDVPSVYIKTGAAATAWTQLGITSSNIAASSTVWYGDGSDGDVTISANTSLSRNTFYNNLTVEAGWRLNTNSWLLCVKDNTDIAATGVISCNGGDGGDGTGAVQGAAGASTNSTGSLGYSAPGGIGGAPGGSVGSQGGSHANGWITRPATSCIGGHGGRGGGGGNTGGTGGTIAQTNTPATGGDIHSMVGLLTGRCYAPGSNGVIWRSGSGGGGGGGSPSGGANGAGGGGGGGGGLMLFRTRTISGAGHVTANGGNGGDGYNAPPDGTGGGGGGGGGLLAVITQTPATTFASYQATGGLFGTSYGNGGGLITVGADGVAFVMREG